MLMKINPVNFEDQEEHKKVSPSTISVISNEKCDYISGILDKSIGTLEKGSTKHFYSFGNFNSMRLIFHIIKNIGPANILMSSYGISPKTIEGIIRRKKMNEILDFRLILDNRVRAISPLPFDMIVRNFNYRCASIHAKVACIWNEDWTVTLISSQNATDNPKIERGIIYTNKEIFDFDYKTLNDVFESGTT